tara:strand:+ start:480 stop:1244 length:765 start_codon:yes stop_codon:yes gene_type:complete
MNGTLFNCNSNGLEIDNMSEVQSVSNLKNLARKANLSGVEIAKQMGFRPETVSRHLNGRQNISIDDAIKYSKILNCTAEEILFKRSMCPIMGEMTNDGVLHMYGEDESKRVYLAGPFNFTENHGAYFVPKWFAKKKNAICIVNKKPIEKKYVHEQCIGQPSICKIKNSKRLNLDGSPIIVGYPFENSDFETYTIRRMTAIVSSYQGKKITYPTTLDDHEPLQKNYNKVELEWATPAGMMLYDPESWGFEIVKDH